MPVSSDLGRWLIKNIHRGRRPGLVAQAGAENRLQMSLVVFWEEGGPGRGDGGGAGGAGSVPQPILGKPRNPLSPPALEFIYSKISGTDLFPKEGNLFDLRKPEL